MAAFLMFLIAIQFQSGSNRKYVIDSNFIEPDSVSAEVDQFVIGNREYLFINAKLSYIQATMLCNEIYEAELAFIKDFPLANFLAEALSETNLIMDSLWIGAVQKKGSTHWWWFSREHKELVDQKIVDNFTYNVEVKAKDRKCLAFSRTNHDEPQFRPLACRARRAVMCERPRGATGSKNSTHPGWIKIGRRYYKIFEEMVTWGKAIENCVQHDSESLLAVVITFEDAQQLGRYLLIGRPSLENAWIGANWIGESYKFEDENLILSNHSDSSNYPPWRKREMRKPGGCILLDRHLANITLFVEAQCQRERPYICYKIQENNSFSDIIIDEDGYRLEFIKRSWEKAESYCKNVYQNYSGKLVEIRELKKKYHLLYVMGENKTTANHIWIGGKLNITSQKWVWVSDNTEINTGNDSILNWVTTHPFEHISEKEPEDDTCISMDRENHNMPLHYPTICRYEQHFVCHFPADDLRRLQEDELINRELANEM